MHTGEYLEDAEERAVKFLELELSRQKIITMQAFDLIGATVNCVPEQNIQDNPLPQKIALSLLVQISNDLRTSSLLALKGYAVQAVTIVSSMFESAYCIAAIGPSVPSAQKWINHSDPARSFMGVKSMVKQGLINLEHPHAEKQTEIEYRVYSQLCMAKHSNPLFQMDHGFLIKNGNVVLINGPNTSENTVRAAWFAMEHATALTFIALLSFFKFHLSSQNNGVIFSQVLALGKARKQLESIAKKKWGTKDPFPGKW